MKVRLNKSLFSVMLIALTTAAFFFYAGMAPMMTDIKTNDNVRKNIVSLGSNTIILTNDCLSTECGIGNKVWQPAVWYLENTPEERITVRF